MHANDQTLLGPPFDDLLNVTGAVGVGDLDSGADDLGRLSFELGGFDAWEDSVTLELGPIGEVENLIGDGFRRKFESGLTVEADRFHRGRAFHSGLSYWVRGDHFSEKCEKIGGEFKDFAWGLAKSGERA